MSKEYLGIVELYKSLEKEEDEEKTKSKRMNLDSAVNLMLNKEGFKLKDEYNSCGFYQRDEEVFVKRDIRKGLSSEFNYAFATLNSDDFEEFKNKCCIKAYPDKGLSNNRKDLQAAGVLFGSAGSGVVIGATIGGLKGGIIGVVCGIINVGFPLSIGSILWSDRKRKKKDRKKIKKFDEEYKGNIIYNEQALEILFGGSK